MTNKILVIEDEPDIRSTLEYNLIKDGFDVIAVGSLVDARAAISMSSFSLILLDLMLPDGSGLDLCQRNEKQS